ncbi:MAG: stage II sporulation protein P [Clostridia bacterium]|nr:stage II sporulation protein P [Clostridia bacterium]
MEQKPMQGALPSGGQKVSLEGTFRGKYRVFAVFLICCALLVAAFAFSAVWMHRGGEDWFFGFGGHDASESEPSDTAMPESESKPPISQEPALPEIPKDAVSVTDKDLSAVSLGRFYLHNETIYHPDVERLLEEDLSRPAATDRPTVLILHTHTSESYLPQGTAYITEPHGDLIYSRDEKENILAVGETLCRALNEKGITALHCTVMHDEPSMSGSYTRAAETIKRYLEQYPEIEYVVDLHRDAVTTADGKIVRSAGKTVSGEEVAQIMAIVGSDGNGTQLDQWEENLALALQLREKLNGEGGSVCRPVSLRNESFNQESARHSLLLEIGTSGNSLEEAKRAAILLADALAELIQPLS